MSKGSKQRPRQVSNDEYAQRWNAIFGKHTEDESETTQEETKEETDVTCNYGQIDCGKLRFKPQIA